jgi:deoxyribose-phosphate aldolase
MKRNEKIMKIKNFSEFLNELVYVNAQAQAPQVQTQPQTQSQTQPQTQPVQDQSLQPQVQPKTEFNINKVNKKINLAYLDKDVNADKTRQLCETAKLPENEKYIFSIMVWPEFISETKKYLEDTNIKVSSVISFPDGTAISSENMKVLTKAVSENVDEIYIVMNHDRLVSSMSEQDNERQTKLLNNIQNEIRNYVEYCKEKSVTIGIIIEMEALGDVKNISKATEICKKANVDLIMTSTGMYNKDTSYDFDKKMKDVEDIIIPMIQGMDDININICGGVNSLDKLEKCLSNGKIQRVTTSMEPQNLLNKQPEQPKYKPQPQDELIVQKNENPQ